MNSEYERKYHLLEKRHWWFLARRDIICFLLRFCKKDSKILEIGCSGGVLLECLKKEGFNNIFGIDKSPEAIKKCKEKGIENASGKDATNTGFSENSFDIVIASDILEHIENDFEAVGEWNRILRQNGILIMFVPAFKFLWSGHDEKSQHFRRYSKSRLKEILKKNNFKTERMSYWNFFLFFPIAAVRIIKKIILRNFSDDDLNNSNAFLNNFLFNIVRFENYLLRFVNFPLGVSLFVVAKKQQ